MAEKKAQIAMEYLILTGFTTPPSLANRDGEHRLGS